MAWLEERDRAGHDRADSNWPWEVAGSAAWAGVGAMCLTGAQHRRSRAREATAGHRYLGQAGCRGHSGQRAHLSRWLAEHGTHYAWLGGSLRLTPDSQGRLGRPTSKLRYWTRRTHTCLARGIRGSAGRCARPMTRPRGNLFRDTVSGLGPRAL